MKHVAFVVGMFGLAVVAACSAEGDDAGGSVPTAEKATVPAGWHRIENPEAGLSIVVPKGWIDIDVKSGEFAEKLRKAEIPGASAEAIERSVAQLKGKNLLYVVDAAGAEREYVNNISGLCAPDEGIGADELANEAKIGLARLGAEDIQTRTLRIGGLPAVKVSYSLNMAVSARAVQFRILAPGDKLCGITFGMKPGKEIKELDQIAGSIRLLS
ncbi:hypothetical protein ACFOY4_04735 [Actinomadura syzygii]|uniref:Lipoprotein n=1 Tax=Actinomadura syzygii TaxID=1427538 RepID=A0A5D0TUY5_9ACTN|nr:hypothetical protein [Actinomadura syzygii]TYC09998.1 hypothetical protein FXF65_33405 [Actinomadura syzygii]